jgi:hypothetical protein
MVLQVNQVAELAGRQMDSVNLRHTCQQNGYDAALRTHQAANYSFHVVDKLRIYQCSTAYAQ